MAVGPFSVTQPNSTHHFTDPTQPTTCVVIMTQPNIEHDEQAFELHFVAVPNSNKM